jgi:hypothetical protein
MFATTNNITILLWRWRWWLIVFSIFCGILIVYSAHISTETGIITSEDKRIQLYFSLISALICAQLASFIICILHALTQHKIKWFFLLLAIPLTPFIYLFLNRNQ